MLRLIYPLIDDPPPLKSIFYVRLFVPTVSKDVVVMMRSLFLLLCSSGLCETI